jgi:hypothetical protein
MYDTKKNVMTCSFCTSMNDNDSSACVTQCDSFKIKNIKNKIPRKVRFSYIRSIDINKDNNTITELRTLLQRESQNS